VGQGLGDHAPRLDVEVRRPAALGLLDEQQLERRVGRLERVAAGLHLLHPRGHPRHQLGVAGEVEAQLAALQLDRGAAGHLRDQQPHVVADAGRVHVLVEVGVDLDRARVQAGLVRERAHTDVGLPRRRRHVGHLGDRVRHPGGLAQAAAREHRPRQLQLEVGHD
jgi:hypothetical protein